MLWASFSASARTIIRRNVNARYEDLYGNIKFSQAVSEEAVVATFRMANVISTIGKCLRRKGLTSKVFNTFDVSSQSRNIAKH